MPRLECRRLAIVRRGLGLTLGLFFAALATACGGDDDGDAAAILAQNQAADSCEAPPLASATLTPFGVNPLPGIATLTAQPDPVEAEGPPSERTVKEVMAAARNFVNCWNDREFEAVIALVTPDYLKAHFVLLNPADILVVLGGSPRIPYTVRYLGEPERHEDGRISLAVEYTWVHQQVAARWYFVKGANGYWLLDQEHRVDFDLGVNTVDVAIDMTEYGYVVDRPVIPESSAVRLHVSNSGGLPHEVFLVQVSSDIDPTTLFQEGVEPVGVEFFGHSVQMAGESGEIQITGMRPGTYIMVCQFRFPGGPIHSDRGMVGLLTVQ